MFGFLVLSFFCCYSFLRFLWFFVFSIWIVYFVLFIGIYIVGGVCFSVG